MLGLRERDALGNLWQVQVVRRELVNKGADSAKKIADREARREVGGTGEAIWWKQLNEEQERFAKGLMPTYIRDAEAFDIIRLIEEAEAYGVYQRALRERGLLDFGEQQLLTIQLLTERPNILRRYQDQFRHVLVDEFQDANMAQILLLELIGARAGQAGQHRRGGRRRPVHLPLPRRQLRGLRPIQGALRTSTRLGA